MKFTQGLSAIALVCGASAALAVPVTVVGTNFDITYDNAFLGLFGAPTLTGNVLSWFPSGSPGFSAQTSAGVDVTNSTFAVQIVAHPGYTLTSVNLAEAGDYFYFGAGSGVSVSGQLRVTPLPGTTSTGGITTSTVFSANPVGSFTPVNWSASAAVAVPAGTKTANLSLQNILAAYATGPSGTFAYSFIEKKEAFVTIGLAQTLVPEPETYAMMLAGVVAVGFLVVRRRNNDR